uniref:Uncharacterized protein n=1 Tax=Oryza glumipatula TaxID=40148 RepID=A0A0E0BGF5_9ORYZ
MGSFEMLLKILKMNNAILRSSLERAIKPNIALFLKCGLSVCDIVTMAQNATWIVTFNPERLKVVLQRAEKLCVTVLGFSETKLRAKIEFLVTKVGLEPDYILRRPVLLAFSLEKRLVPRHYVVEALAVKGLIRKGYDFYHCVCIRDDVFVAKYIDHYENALPGLADAYAAVRAGKLPAQV